MRQVTTDDTQISIKDIDDRLHNVLVSIDKKLYQVTSIRHKSTNIFMLTDTITLEHYRIQPASNIKEYITPMLTTNEVYIKEKQND